MAAPANGVKGRWSSTGETLADGPGVDKRRRSGMMAASIQGGTPMRIAFVAIAATALALAACSEQTEDNAAATANEAGDTVASAADDTAENVDAAVDNTAAAANEGAENVDAAVETPAH
jgi:methyl-accepting chemotaxis protein